MPSKTNRTTKPKIAPRQASDATTAVNARNRAQRRRTGSISSIQHAPLCSEAASRADQCRTTSADCQSVTRQEIRANPGMSGIMLFQHDGAIRLSQRLPHQGALNCGPDGSCSAGKWLICAHHSASFDLRRESARGRVGAALRAEISGCLRARWLDQPLESLVRRWKRRFTIARITM
jgi:nitrite reductase/ring-hydroxylating ferredoxin subunit